MTDYYYAKCVRLPAYHHHATVKSVLLSTRKRHKLTQTTVAHRAGLSYNRISHLKQHPYKISVKQLLSWYSIGLELRFGEQTEGERCNSSKW